MFNWYLRGLFEGNKYQQKKYKHINPTTIEDSELLEIICEVTGMTEPQVINEALQEIRKRSPGFIWNFDEYFKQLKLQLHPLVRDELRRAYFVLHNN